jgi:hypothetical protein
MQGQRRVGVYMHAGVSLSPRLRHAASEDEDWEAASDGVRFNFLQAYSLAWHRVWARYLNQSPTSWLMHLPFASNAITTDSHLASVRSEYVRLSSPSESVEQAHVSYCSCISRYCRECKGSRPELGEFLQWTGTTPNNSCLLPLAKILTIPTPPWPREES